MCEILEKDHIHNKPYGLVLIDGLEDSLEHLVEAKRVKELGFDNKMNRAEYKFHVKEFKETLESLNRMAEEL